MANDKPTNQSQAQTPSQNPKANIVPRKEEKKKHSDVQKVIRPDRKERR
jgi:hypothetical protein